MNTEVEEILNNLLKKYPELKNQTLSFNENNVTLNTDKPALCLEKEPMPDVLLGISSKIEIRKSTVHGFGVFAKEKIEAGELIEESVLLELNDRGKNNKIDKVLQNYIWSNQHCSCRDCELYGQKTYIGFGYISLYNHADTPNTKQQINYSQCVARIWAERTIEANEEIFINYGHKYWIIRDFWAQIHKKDAIAQFHKANIQPKIK